MGQYRANADITVNGKLVKTGATFAAKSEEAQGFIANGQAVEVSVSVKTQAATQSKRTKKGR